MVKNCKLETARLRHPGFKIRGRDLKTPKLTESPENETSRPASQTLLRSSRSGQTFLETHVFCVPDDVFLALTVNRYGYKTLHSPTKENEELTQHYDWKDHGN